MPPPPPPGQIQFGYVAYNTTVYTLPRKARSETVIRVSSTITSPLLTSTPSMFNTCTELKAGSNASLKFSTTYVGAR